MVEKQTTARAAGRSAHLDDAQNSRQVTQLDGISKKVFMDRYSLKGTDGKPLEFYPEQLWARVARGIASVEQNEEQQHYWEGRFY